MMNVSIDLIAIVALLVAALGFLWSIHRDVANLRKDVGRDIADLRKDVGADIADVRKDVADLRERMARVESLLGNLVRHPPKPQT